MEKQNIGIYRFLNTTNGKSYIGRSNDLRHRYCEHINLLRKGIEPCTKLNRAWQKYGEESFVYEILCYCAEDMLNTLEKYYIQKFDSFKNGYNCTTGGGGIVGYRHTAKTKEKIGRASKGKTYSAEERKKMSERQKGRRLTDAHKKALSEAWNEDRRRLMTATRSGENNPNYGKTGRFACNRTAVISNTGDFFFTIADAAKWCNLSSRGNISSCCRGKRARAGRHPETGEPLTWCYASSDEIKYYEAKDS